MLFIIELVCKDLSADCSERGYTLIIPIYNIVYCNNIITSMGLNGFTLIWVIQSSSNCPKL